MTAKFLSGRWAVVAASTIGNTVSAGPINVFTFGVFLRPVTESLGIGRGVLGSAMLATYWIGAVLGPVLGVLLDRFGARRVLLVGSAVFAVVTAAQSFLTASLTVIYILFALRALSAVCVSPVSFAFVVVKWFDRRRGLALGIAMAGVGLGTSIVPPIAAHLIDAYGWRVGYIGLGLLILVLAGLPAAFVIREPEEAGRAALTEIGRRALPGLLMREALCGWRFWALTAAFLIGVVVLNGTLTQIVAMLQDRGWSLQQATTVLAAAGVAAIIGRLLSGWCVDRFHGPYVAIAFFLMPMIGTALFASGAGWLGPLLGSLLCGSALGAEIDLMGFFVGRYFGIRAYGTIFGTMFGLFASASGVGPFISGLSFDHYHSYLPAFALYEGLLVIACLLFLPLGSYPFPARHHVEIVPAKETA